MGPERWTDGELIERCLREENGGWREFVRRYGGVLYAAIRRQLSRMGYARRTDLRDDIFQEIFRDFFEKKKLGLLRQGGAVRSFLAAVAVTRTVDYLRRLGRHDRFFVQEPEWAAAGESRGVGESSPGASETAAWREAQSCVESEVEKLPSKEEFVVRLSLLHGMGRSDISRLADVSENTISTIVHRTRAKLQEILKEKGFEEP